MVNLLSNSLIDPVLYPNLFQWDSAVRKHHQHYQNLIDSVTYRLQRIQRGILSLPYPKYYSAELLTLQLLKRKQQVGQVQQTQIDLYKNIDPCIATHFNRAFSSSLPIPYTGIVFGGVFFAYSTIFSFSVPTRIVSFGVPLLIDWLWRTNDPVHENKSLDFLNWVVGYRKAKCFSQYHKKQFKNEQITKLLGNRGFLQVSRDFLQIAAK